jgi:hypothetical protein
MPLGLVSFEGQPLTYDSIITFLVIWDKGFD